MATGSGQLHLKDPTSLDDSQTEISKRNIEETQSEIQSPTEPIYESSKQISSDDSSSDNETKNKYSLSKIARNDRVRDAEIRDMFDMKFSCYAENSLVFWWIGEVPDLT